ncbi:MAG: XkdF-like putative serine protease domain-containing protein [Candidatus Odinarchaeota archaeon]
MPETTENYHRIPVRDCKITATINIGDGIKALYCGNEKQIATYLFPVDQYSMAQAQAWVKEHKQKSMNPYTLLCPIMKLDEEKRLVYGVVLEPETVDLQDDIVSVDEIEKAAHGFMMDSRAIYYEHAIKEPDSRIVESYLAPIDFEMNGQIVKQGSWVMVTYCGNDDVWKQLKDGELTGYSIRGSALRT